MCICINCLFCLLFKFLFSHIYSSKPQGKLLLYLMRTRLSKSHGKVYFLKQVWLMRGEFLETNNGKLPVLYYAAVLGFYVVFVTCVALKLLKLLIPQEVDLKSLLNLVIPISKAFFVFLLLLPCFSTLSLASPFHFKVS